MICSLILVVVLFLMALNLSSFASLVRNVIWRWEIR